MPEPSAERCPTCGTTGPDRFEYDYDTQAMIVTCGDEWHNAPPQPTPSARSFESIGKTEAAMANDPDLEGHVEQPAPDHCRSNKNCIGPSNCICVCGPCAVCRIQAQPTPADRFEDALNQLHENVERAAMDYSEAEHLNMKLFDKVRAAHAEAVARARSAAAWVSCKELVDAARAEGRREMAREALDHYLDREYVRNGGITTIRGTHCHRKWLEARAGDSK